MKKYVMDSFAMIAFFEDEPGANKVTEILDALMKQKAKAFMSVVNWGGNLLQYDEGAGN